MLVSPAGDLRTHTNTHTQADTHSLADSASVETPPSDVCPFHFIHTLTASTKKQKHPSGNSLEENCTAKRTQSFIVMHTHIYICPAGTYGPCCSAVLNHTPYTHAKIHILCTCFLFGVSICLSRTHTCTQPRTQTAPLTPEVLVEARHQVEGCVLFRGGFAPYLPCHLVTRIMPQFVLVSWGH